MVRFTTRAALVAALPVFILGFSPATVSATDDVVAIEEHWELIVGGPEVDRCAPQVSLVVSPNGDLHSDYFVFLMNHSTVPSFAAGGLQLQHWNGDTVVSTNISEHVGTLSYDQEVITWVQHMTLQNGTLKMDIQNGQSQTWGGFGQGSNLSLTVPTSLQRLNDYRPAVSLEESGIAFAGNRVSSLTLTKLRWTTSDGEVHELVAPIDIDADIDP